MLGSPRVITDSNGNVTSRRDFQPFGEELFPDGSRRTSALKYGSADGIRQKFTSYQRDDETLLDFAEARMYENRFGRFTAVDPLLASGKSKNPQTFNRYAYTSNNPVNRVDVNGLDWYVAFHYVKGRGYYMTPSWCRGFGCRGFKWGSSGTFKLGGQWRNWDARSFAFQDEKNGGFAAFDFYENRSAQFNTIEDAQNQIESWNRQAAVNFLAGALEGASLAFELTGAADGVKAERDSEMFKMGKKAGTGASIAGGLTGVGLLNALTNSFKGARSIFKGISIACCFVEGTPIHTDKGLVSIEQIKVGDKVLSYDEKTKTYEYKPVAQTFTAVKENIVKIKIRGEKLLTTTTEHPFYVRKTNRARDNLSSESDDKEGEWLTASELEVGQKVLRPDGLWTRITSIERSTEPTIVYNLEVEGNHNYFVGEIGVLSHNCKAVDIAKNITSKWGVGSCIQCAGELIDAFKNAGIKGEVLRVELGYKVNIWSNTAGEVISTNGVHEAVRVGDLVFDNIHKNGISYDQWIKDFVTNLPGGNIGTPGTRPF